METNAMGLIAFLMTAEIGLFFGGQMKYPLENTFWLWFLITQLVGNLIAMYAWLEERFLRKRFEHEIEVMSNEREQHAALQETLARVRINTGRLRVMEWNRHPEQQNWLNDDSIQEEPKQKKEPEQKRPPAKPPNVLRNLLSRRKKN